MKKAFLIGTSTLALSVMVVSGVGSALASSQEEKEVTALEVKSTDAVKVTPEERAALEKEALNVKGTPVVNSTDAVLEAKGTPAVETTPAMKATPEELAELEEKSKTEDKTISSTVASTPSVDATKK